MAFGSQNFLKWWVAHTLADAMRLTVEPIRITAGEKPDGTQVMCILFKFRVPRGDVIIDARPPILHACIFTVIPGGEFPPSIENMKHLILRTTDAVRQSTLHSACRRGALMAENARWN